MILYNSDTVAKHRMLVKAKMDLTANEHKIFNVVVSQVKKNDALILPDSAPGDLTLRDMITEPTGKYDDIIDNLPRIYIEIPYDVFYKNANISTRNLDYLKRTLSGMKRHSYTFWNKEADIWQTGVFFPRIRYANSIFKIEIAPVTYAMITELDGDYLSYKLRYIMNLKSEYDIRIYELFRDILGKNTGSSYKGGTVHTFDVPELIELIQLPKSDKRYTALKSKLNTARKDIWKHTDIGFDEISRENEIKQGRKVVKIKVRIFFKSKNNKD